MRKIVQNSGDLNTGHPNTIFLRECSLWLDPLSSEDCPALHVTELGVTGKSYWSSVLGSYHMQINCAFVWKEKISPPTGFEPRTFWSWANCVNHFTTPLQFHCIFYATQILKLNLDTEFLLFYHTLRLVQLVTVHQKLYQLLPCIQTTTGSMRWTPGSGRCGV